MKNSTKRIAVVTGGNRGLGFETCRQLAKQGIDVILTARDSAKGQAAADLLKKEGLSVTFRPLDVASPESIDRFVREIQENPGRVDILVNNAGIFINSFKREDIRTSMEANVYGPMDLCMKLLPMMKRNGYGRVVNVSTGMAQLKEMDGEYAAYRISKVGLNAVTRIFATEYRGSGVLVNAIAPGWVKTDMGGANAELTVEQGVDTIVWAATLPDNGPTGGFFEEREQMDW